MSDKQFTIEDAAKEYAFEVVPPDYCYDNMTDEIRELVKNAYIEGAMSIQNIRIRDLQQANQNLSFLVGQNKIYNIY